MLNLESLSLYSEHTSKARERKREVACLHAIRQTSQSARKVPVNYLSASVRERGGSRRPIATIKVVRAAYYSHVRIRRETPRFPSSPSIRRLPRGDRSLPRPFFRREASSSASSRRLWRSTDRESLLTFAGRGGERGSKIVRQISFREGWWDPLLLEHNFWKGAGGTATGSGF